MMATIRRATSADRDALGRLGASLMHVHHAFDAQRFIDPRVVGQDFSPATTPASVYAAFLDPYLDSDDSIVFVAERDGDIIGYVFAAIEPSSFKELRDRAGFIHDLLVDDAARGDGVGQVLLDAAIAWLTERNVPRIILWSAEQNTGAQRLFARAGFRRTMVEMTREG